MFTMHPWLWLLIIAVIIWKINLSSAETRVVCYYTNWSVYRPGTAKFNPQNINPYLCTHLIYAFGGFTKENNFKPFDKYQDIEKGGYAKFTGLKTYNKNLKTMLAVGGWNEGSSRFSPMVANQERRKEFVKNSIKFLRQNHFDGLDLDWEYPSFRDGGKPRDRDNYATLVQELREEYDREAEKTGRPRLLLTMAVPAGIEYINKGYDVPRLMKYLDWMNILSYDYHSAFEPAVNHHSPLFSLEEESEYNYDAELNINHTINHYLEAGAIQSKLVLGIPTYGRSYTLFNPDATEIGDPADGPGEMGDATRENGYLAYYEICEKVKSEDWVIEQPDPNAMGPYAYKDDQWVGYDDENIVRKKAEFVAHRRLGGIMFWSIDNDDFRGNCHGKPYPLIEAAKEALMTASGYTIDNAIAPEKPTKTKTRSRTRQNNKKTSVDDEEDSKPAQNSGGRQSVDAPASRKRVRTKSQNKDEESEVSNKRRLRVQKKKEEVEEPEEEEEEEEEEEAPKKRRLRVHKQNSNRRKEPKRRGTTTTTTTTNRPSALTPAYHTPEPPTTPDPGSDFKCEDEGFFPHPRDCKKYFWCLSSGPSELGIVAHQFTCPSGLYFNKAADSCDYTQNVLCKKKAKAASTTTTTTSTTTTTTAASVSTSTTRRPPPKITAATARTTFISPKTTTSEYEEEYEYEDEDEDEELEDEEDSEEDPRVIKELIDLIRKAGGIEELEKQLKLHEDGSVSVTAPGSTTPPAFSKTLYERVLSRAAGRNTEKPSTKPKNSRGPQYDGVKDEDGNKRTRPQYTAITRQRASTEKPHNDEQETGVDTADNSKSRKILQPQYKTIARSRPSTSTTSTETDTETTTSSRLRGDTVDEENDGTTKLGPEYVTIRRKRPTTQEPTPKYIEIRGRTSSVNYNEEGQHLETTTFSGLTRNNKTSELSNNEYINTVEQQNITDTVEVPKTAEGRNVPAEESKFGTGIDGTTQLSLGSQNSTENALSEDERRYRSSTILIEPSTTPSTKVSDPISSRNLLRPKPFQKTTESTDTSNSSTNVTENTTKRGSNRFTIQDTSSRFKNTRNRPTFRKSDDADSHKDLIDEDFPDTEQENISNETDSPTVSDRISLRNKLKIESGSKQTVPLRPRPFAPKKTTNTDEQRSAGEKAPEEENKDSVITRTESSNQQGGPTRRRGSAKFAVPQFESGQPEERYHYYDDGSYDSRSLQERKYRPDIAQEIADLSSLTSADISAKKSLDGASRRRNPSRQRVNSTEKAANSSDTFIPVKNEEQEGNLKTSPRTVPLNRKVASGTDFGKNIKRVRSSSTTITSTTAADEPSSTTQTSRLQKKSPVFIRQPAFRRPLTDKTTLNESTSDKPSLPKPLQRKVFNSESSTRRRLDVNHENVSQEASSEHPVTKSNRKVIRRFRPTPSTTSTTVSTTATTTTTTTTTPAPTTTTESQENNIASDDFTTTSSTTTTELNNEQQNITEIMDFTQNTTYENSVSELPDAVTQDNDINNNITEKGSSDNDDDVYRTSEEEEENIKLSETSIREKSEIHINALNDNSDKHRRRVVKRIRNEGKTSQTKFNYPEEDQNQSKEEEKTAKINTDAITEHSPVLRTRKIIRKLPQTTFSTVDTPTTQSSVSEAHKGRTRKIIRRLRPTTTESPSTAAQNTLEESLVTKTVKPKLYGSKRIRPTHSKTTAAVPETSSQKESDEIEQKGNEYPRFNYRRRQNVKVQNETVLTNSSEVDEQKPVIKRIIPQRRQKVRVSTSKENSEEEASEEKTVVNLQKGQKFRPTESENKTESEVQKPLIRRVIPQRRQKIKIFGAKDNSSESINKQEEETVNNSESLEKEVGKRKSILYGSQRKQILRSKLNITESSETVSSEDIDDSSERTETESGKETPSIVIRRPQQFRSKNKTEGVDSGENTETESSEEKPLGTKIITEGNSETETDKSAVSGGRTPSVLIRKQNFGSKNTNESQINEELSGTKQNGNESINLTTESRTYENDTSNFDEIKQNVTETTGTTETESSTNFDEGILQNGTDIGHNNISTTEYGVTTEEEFTTVNTDENFSTTALSGNNSPNKTESEESEEKDDTIEKVVETSTKFYRTKLNRIQKITTTTHSPSEKPSRVSIYSRFNTNRKDILKPQPKPTKLEVDTQQTNDESQEEPEIDDDDQDSHQKYDRGSHEKLDDKNHEITSETFDGEKLESITEPRSTTEFSDESLQSSTEIDDHDATTINLNEEEDTTLDLDGFTEPPTTEMDFTTTDVPNITAETEKTTIKTTTPFYYRQKLSRPPFLLQRSRPVTEASRPIISTSPRQFTRSGGFSRYSTRKDRFKSRFDKKVTTEAALVENNNNEAVVVNETPQNLTTENYNSINATSGSTASTEITGSSISTISTFSALSTLSTTTAQYETTKEIVENEISTGSTEYNELDAITTEFGTTTETYDEKPIIGVESLGANVTTQNITSTEGIQVEDVSDTVQTATLNSTNLSSTVYPVTASTEIPSSVDGSTEQLTIEDIQQITDSILEKELLALIEKYEQEKGTLPEGFLNQTSGNETEIVEKILLESLFNTNLTVEQVPSDETRNVTDVSQNADFNILNVSTEIPNIKQTDELLASNVTERENSTTLYQTGIQKNSTSLRRGFATSRRTFTTTRAPSKEHQEDLLNVLHKINGDDDEESSQRPSFKPSSPRSRYKPRAKPTERTLLYKQTTKTVTLSTNLARNTPNRRIFLRPTTERTKLNQQLHNQGVTEKSEEEYYDDEVEEDDEEYAEDDVDGEGDANQEEEEEDKPKEEHSEEEKVEEDNTEADRTSANSFYRQNKPQYVPKRTGFRATTEKPSSLGPRRFGKVPNSPITKQANNPVLQGNAETKNSRNRLFNKSRKANTPFAGGSSSTTSTTTTTTTAATTTTLEETATPTPDFSNPITLTTAVYEQEDTIQTTTSTTTGEARSTTDASDQPFTLQHIFSEPENASTTETYADATDTSANKQERLIEVNRIVEVSLKEGKFKHNAMVENQVTLIPTLDRVGAINRVTVIKVVDPINGTNSSEIVFNITDGSGRVELSANITLPVGLNASMIEQENLINDSINAIYSDINNSFIDNVNISVENRNNVSKIVNNTQYNLIIGTKLEEHNLNNLSNEIPKQHEQNTSNIIQLYGAGELTDYGHKLEAYMPPHTKEEEDYAKAHIRIDGKSVVNTFTPKPSAFNTESSTISLEGLFQPHIRQDDPNDEILQTQNANYVNIKILEQDGSPRRLQYNENQPLVPIRLLKQDEYTTSRAQVIEITPEMDSGVIKIAPIAISLGNMERVSHHRQSDYTEHTTTRTPLKNFSRRPNIRSTSTRFRQSASSSTTPASVVSSRPTKTSRRKHHSPSPTTVRSQVASEATRQPSRNFLRFSSRKPFMRMTTLRSIDQTVKYHVGPDQTLESSNQQSLEKELQDDTTKLGDLATVLNELQKASVRPRNTNRVPNQNVQNKIVQPARRLISTTVPPVYETPTEQPPQVYPTTFIVRQQQPRPFEKVVQRIPQTHIFEPLSRNYDYYDDGDTRYVTQLPANSKVLLHSSGIIQCLDQGNFPHPASCKKFIYCAKIDNGDILGWEYTCPKNLSFDPVGGICNWSAGLGCNE